MSRCVVRGGCVMWWIGRCSGDPYYKVLLRTARYYKILIRTAQYYQVLLRTTRNYKELLRTTKYDSVLQSTNPFDSRNTWNAQYIARSNRSHPRTSPNIAPATKNHSDDWSLSHTKRPVQCAEQQVWPSNLTKYCACHEKSFSWLILVTDETSFTMRGATGVTSANLAPARKMAPMIDPRHTWNVIYLTRSNRRHPPTSPNTAPATKNDSHHWSSGIYETSFTMRRTTSINLQPHQILRLPGKIALLNLREICRNLQWRTIPAWSDHDPNTNSSSTRIPPNAAPATKTDTPTSPKRK